MAIFISAAVFLAVTTGVLAVGCRSQQRAVVVKRLSAFGRPKKQRAQSEPTQTLWKRGLAYAAQMVAAWTPQHTKDELRRQLLMAGSPGSLQTAEFIVVKAGVAGLAAFVGRFLPMPLVLRMGMIALAWFLPGFCLKRKVVARQQAIQRGIPDMLDLLTVSVEAGLGFDAAVANVVSKSTGPLSEELRRMLQEMRIGKPRKDALRSLCERTQVQDLRGFVTAIIQADQLGVSVGSVLRIQCAQLRRQRRQRAEEEAMKAPVKMLFPLVLFVFPTLFVVLLGPAVLRFLATLG